VVKNEYSYTTTLLVCLHGVDEGEFTFFFLPSINFVKQITKKSFRFQTKITAKEFITFANRVSCPANIITNKFIALAVCVDESEIEATHPVVACFLLASDVLLPLRSRTPWT
jgi:hypothetical protein